MIPLTCNADKLHIEFKKAEQECYQVRRGGARLCEEGPPVKSSRFARHGTVERPRRGAKSLLAKWA